MKIPARVKKWADFQHYKDRSPPWIKLERKLLDDFDFSRLPLASKALLPLIWLLASESNDGHFDANPEFLAYRLRWDMHDLRTGLKPLFDMGFLLSDSDMLAACLQDACLETETETEGETEGEVCPSNDGQVITNGDHVLSHQRMRICPTAKIVDLYHRMLPQLPRVEKLTDKRRKQIQQRWREDLPELENWEFFFDFVKKSDFLMGRSPPTPGRSIFRADIEFLTNATNYTKIAEEKYHR